jgi:PAS domain S-box-containing protein
MAGGAPQNGGHDAGSELYRREVQRRVAARVPAAFALLIGSGAIATVFEVLRFPERLWWMLGADAVYSVLAAMCISTVRVRPDKSVVVGAVATNLLGLVLNAYHAIVGAQIAMCIWTLTALLCSSAILLPWGWRAQAVASAGAVIGYPLLLHGGEAVVLQWAAGGAYLAVVIGMSLVGAGLIDRYLRKDFDLSHALTEREGRLQTYFDLSLVGTAILTRAGGWLEVNEELCRMLGYEREVLLRTPRAHLIPEAERTADREQYAAALRGDHACVSREARLIRRDRGTIEAIVSVRALPGPLGERDHLMVVVQDVTDRRRAEREREALLAGEQAARRVAEAASRAKDEFLAVASHELRTPLTGILGWASLLREDDLEADQRQRGIDSIERNARSLSQLIDDLLDVSRIVSGKVKLDVRPVRMGGVVEAAVESMRPAALAKGIALRLTVDDEVVRVLGDPDRLQQVVWNLIANAIKFSDAGGEVEVSVRPMAGQVVTRIRDTGQGIDADLLPHVFERFWQADTRTSRAHGGLGLGLAIVRHLVELHGGTVRAESAGAGQGSAFTVSLPERSVVDASRRDPRDQGRGGVDTLHGARVLVVDDEAEVQDVVRVALERRGVEVRTAGSATQALEVLEGWAPNVLVSDIAMAGQDGYSLIREVRARESVHGGHVPAIAFTALAHPDDHTRALEAGFDGWVAKPADPATLVAAVAGMARAAGNGR